MKISELLTHFLNHCRAKGLSDNTLRHYERHVHNLTKALGDPSIEEVSHRDIETYLSNLQEKYTSGGIGSRYSAWSAFFTWAEEEGEIDRSPIGRGRKQAKRPKLIRNPPPVLDQHVVLQMVKEAAKSSGKGNFGRNKFECVRDQAVLALLYDTGLRADEICQLPEDGVNLTSRQVLVTGKGGKTRAIPFGAVTATMLGRYVRIKQKKGYGGPYFWVTREGLPWVYSALYRMVKRTAKRAGIVGKIHPHLFRHTFSHQYLLEGGKEGDLMRLLGHSSSRLIHELYGASAAGERARIAYKEQGTAVDKLISTERRKKVL